MHIIYHKNKRYVVEDNGDIYCAYAHPKSKDLITWRKLRPTGKTAWEVRKAMARKEKAND